MSHERPPEKRAIDWAKIMEEALTAPGNLMGQYDRFHNYSFFNMLYLRMQGTAEPIATKKRWAAIGRTVLQGSRPKEIIAPVIVDKKNDEGNVKPTLVGFKPVKCIYTLSETTGEPLPPVQLPEWDENTALERLKIRRVPFRSLNPNIHGYSYDRNIAVSEIATNPTKTLIHELAHVILGHTLHRSQPDMTMHRGIQEFQSEATAYLTLNEAGRLDEQTASVSRAYIQDWLDGERPPDAAIRQVFTATDVILKAGRVAVVDVVK